MTGYKVSWDQWYRCGYDGDDTDYEPMSRTFQHLCDANQFIDDQIGLYQDNLISACGSSLAAAIIGVGEIGLILVGLGRRVNGVILDYVSHHHLVLDDKPVVILIRIDNQWRCC